MEEKSPNEYLNEACENNDIQGIIDALKLGANINNKDGNLPPLYLACMRCENKEIIEYLLENGADPNIQTKMNKLTPLMQCSISGRLDIATVLLDRGADVNIIGFSMEWTALSYSYVNGRVEVFKELINRGASTEFLGYVDRHTVFAGEENLRKMNEYVQNISLDIKPAKRE